MRGDESVDCEAAVEARPGRLAVREADVAAADLGDAGCTGAAYDDAPVAVGAEVVVWAGPAIGEAIAVGRVDAEHELRVVVSRHGMGVAFCLSVCFVEERGLGPLDVFG